MTRNDIIREVVHDYSFFTAGTTLIPYLRTSDTYTLGIFFGRMRRNYLDALAIGAVDLADRIDQVIAAAHAMHGIGVKP